MFTECVTGASGLSLLALLKAQGGGFGKMESLKSTRRVFPCKLQHDSNVTLLTGSLTLTQILQRLLVAGRAPAHTFPHCCGFGRLTDGSGLRCLVFSSQALVKVHTPYFRMTLLDAGLQLILQACHRHGTLLRKQSAAQGGGEHQTKANQRDLNWCTHPWEPLQKGFLLQGVHDKWRDGHARGCHEDPGDDHLCDGLLCCIGRLSQASTIFISDRNTNLEFPLSHQRDINAVSSSYSSEGNKTSYQW